MTQLFKINSLFAQKNKIPVYFAANILVETAKAYYLYGRGTLESQKIGCCCVCGRTLTHPVSVLLGIGPECGGHYWDWNVVGGFTEENLAKLRLIIFDMKIDQWIPKSCVKEITTTSDVVETPNEHVMLKRPESPAKAKRIANWVQYQNTGMPAIKIMFPFDMADLDRIKSIPGRRFHDEGSSKYWSCPFSIETVELLLSWGFLIDEKLNLLLAKSKIPATQLVQQNIPGLKGSLFPFQQIGVSFLESRNGRALIADEMGLGKTVQALAYLQLHPELRPAVVVCPASLKLNWEKEAEAWMPNPRCQLLSGTKTDVPLIGDILIINYDILPVWAPVLEKIKPQVLITDECHYYKNNGANRTKAVKKLGKTIPHVIALSGTPIVNRPIEIYNAVNMIDNSVIPDFWKYAKKYCGAKHNGFGWDFSGASNTQELHELLSKSLMIRRKKADVLLELPDKIYDFTPMELNNDKDYFLAENDFSTFVRMTKGQAAAERAEHAMVLAQIEGLKQLAVQGKLEQCIEWIRDFIEVDGKLIVFAVHKFVIDAIMEAFPGVSVKIDGSVSNENRQDAVNDFQTNDRIKLFVGNIKAAGVGLTLTAASNVAFVEYPWSPGELTQAIDRAHRIGQKECVTIHYLVAVNTIEEKIIHMLDKKARILDQVLDGTAVNEMSLFHELMKEFNR